MDESGGSPIGEVWQILPNSQETNEQPLVNNQMAQVIATDEASADGIQQIIYVSYQDPDDPNQSRTLHFGIVDLYFIYTSIFIISIISIEIINKYFARYCYSINQLLIQL